MTTETTHMAMPMDHFIDSLNHPLAATIEQCLRGTAQDQQTPILIEDENNILTALQQGITATHVIAIENHHTPTAIQQQLPNGVTTCTLKKRTAKKLFGSTRLSELFILAKRPPQSTLSDLDRQRDILVLDGLTITGNIGAICRSAAAFGVAAMVMTRTTVNPYDRRIIRASRGQVFRCPIILCTPNELIAHCQQQSIDLMVLNAHAETNINTLSQHKKPVAMVFGSEKKGTDHSLQQAATKQLCIPMHHALDSLNVSVAVGICLHQRSSGRS